MVRPPVAICCVAFALACVSVCAATGLLGQPRAHRDELIQLGKELFSDARLSADAHTSCASCHQPSHAYSDNRAVSLGIGKQTGSRNAPSLETIGRSAPRSYFWDGRRASLKDAVMDPFANPVELGLKNDDALVELVNHQPAYRTAFQRAFPGTTEATRDEIAEALATFVRSLDARESPYDKYAATGDISLLDARAQAGMKLFRGKAQCAECHKLDGTPASFTDFNYHRTGVGLDAVATSLPALTERVMSQHVEEGKLGNLVAESPAQSQLGRFNVTHDPVDIGLFRTPSLRAVSLTAPYMHDGSIGTLDEAIDREVYYRSLQAGHPMQLTQEERRELKAFLMSL